MNQSPGDLKNLLLRAEVIGRTNWLHAVNILEKAAEDFPRERSIYLTLGDVYNRHRKFEQAIDSYQKALTIDASDEQLLSVIGNCYLSLSDYKMALYYYDQVSDDTPELIYNKALAYAYSGEHELCLHHLKTLVKLVRDNANIYYFLIEELLRLHKYHEATIILDDMEKRFGVQRYEQVLKGFVWSFRKVWLKAYIAFKNADEITPITNPDHLNSYAQAAWQIGQLDKAIALFRRGLELNPRYSSFHESLIRILIQTGDLIAAEKALNIAMRMLGNSDPLLIVLRDKLHKLQNPPDPTPDGE